MPNNEVREMKAIGTLQIAGQKDIVLLRSKTRLLAKTLSFSNMEATKMALLISEISREVSKATLPFSIDFSITQEKHASIYCHFTSDEELMFGKNNPYEKYFDHIRTTEIENGNYRISFGKFLPHKDLVLDEVLMGRAKADVLRLSETELLSVLERKNHELNEAYKALEKSQQELLARTQKLAKVGGWEINLGDMSLSWTEGVYQIHELNRDKIPKLEDGVDFYAPEARPVITKAIEEAIEKGKTWDLELPFVTAKGNPRWVRAIGYPERKDGKTHRLSGILQDITDRKVAEQKLQESNQRFQLVVEGSGAGIWDWLDTNGDEEWWSPKFYELLGFTGNEIESSLKSFQNMIHPGDSQHTFDKLEEHFKERSPFEIEYRLKTKSGKYKWFLGSGQAQWDSKGNPVRMAGSIIDIDARKKTELEIGQKNEELEGKNKELEQFAYIASHDLQEPLRTVKSFTELLENEYGDRFDETGKKSLRFISGATARMSQLIKGLLDYSRIGKNKELTMVDCNKLIKEIRDDLALTVSGTKATFEVGKLPVLNGYETELRQLFQNLISNAIKFQTKDSPPHVKITAFKKNGFWKFAVTDNGIGIAPDHQEKIFNIFQRLHSRDQFEGTGIGLSHSRKIVNSHGGKIWVDSKPSIGSTFNFTIKNTLK